MVVPNGAIVILSYPDTVVRPAHWEYLSRLWPLIGIGSKHAIQAGHAALLLIENNNTEVNYYDFGRYITSYGNGRLRSKETDPEILIPIKARFQNGRLTNLEELLLWLENHPEKTHGKGRLVASVNYSINYFKAKNFIDDLIKQKEIPYGAFIKKGSNCARFVTDTLINSCTNNKIRRKLKFSYLLTPSPIGNTLKGTTENTVYQVINQKIKEYTNTSILKEYKSFFLNRHRIEPKLEGNELPNLKKFHLKTGTWLGGIGSGAWFNIEELIDHNRFKFARYKSNGEKDFEGYFISHDLHFNHKMEHQFIHPSNCDEIYIKQNNSICYFKRL